MGESKIPQEPKKQDDELMQTMQNMLQMIARINERSDSFEARQKEDIPRR